MSEEEIGVVRHYFDKINVAAIELTTGDLAVGDKIRIKGHTTELEEDIASIQIEHEQVQTAARGQTVGIKVVGKTREHDKVFKVTGE